MKKLLTFLIVSFLLLANATSYANYSALRDPDIQNYIEYLIKKYDFDRERMERLFSTVTMSEEVTTKLNKPFEAQPWYLYRNSFLTAERINKGVDYWNQNAATLALAEKKYGVPASIIVAIIGVETKYGANKGKYPVFNTLVSLAFNHGRRANFFRSELTEYLLLTRENQLKPLLLNGSYAGALGLPQFMPSSYRHYAIDCYHKGYADLFENDADAIASVGNYLNKKGWKPGTPVAVQASVGSNCESIIATKTCKPNLTQHELSQYSITPAEPIGSNKACLIRLEVENGSEYWLGLQNFYAISQYNKSQLYVMAVNLLAQKLREAKYCMKSVRQEPPQPLMEKPAMLSNDGVDGQEL